MKALLTMTLATLISTAAFAKDLLIYDCTDKIHSSNKLKVYAGKPGEGGDGLLIKYEVNENGSKVTKAYDLKWNSAGHADQNNITTSSYSNQSYGALKHDENNILHKLDIVFNHDKNDELSTVEVTLIKAVSMKVKDYKELYTAAFADNYTCEIKVK